MYSSKRNVWCCQTFYCHQNCSFHLSQPDVICAWHKGVIGDNQIKHTRIVQPPPQSTTSEVWPNRPVATYSLEWLELHPLHHPTVISHIPRKDTYQHRTEHAGRHLCPNYLIRWWILEHRYNVTCTYRTAYISSTYIPLYVTRKNTKCNFQTKCIFMTTQLDTMSRKNLSLSVL